MTKLLWQALKQSPGVLGVTLLMASSAFGAEVAAPNANLSETAAPLTTAAPLGFSNSGSETLSVSQFKVSQPPAETPVIAQNLGNAAVPSVDSLSQPQAAADGMAQVTSITQLSDVQPTDWAYQALQSLVERYNCIVGYPDGTYRGNRALTRYEFAAGVNACLDRVNELIASAVADKVTREDLAILQRLQEEFAAELAVLRGRVDALEARTSELEANQFSTTTKLQGEVLFQMADTWGDRATGNKDGDNEDDSDAFLGYRVRLSLNTSFTGRDLLRTRLQSINIGNLADVTGTNMTRLQADGLATEFKIDDLWYRFPIGKGQAWIGASALELDDVATLVLPRLNDSGAGSISRFGRRNPAVFRGPDGAGVGIQYPFSDSFQFSAAYLAEGDDAGEPTQGQGIFNGDFSALAQLVWKPSDQFALSLAYARKYESKGDINGIMGATGSNIANRPFGQNPTTSDNAGIDFNWRLAKGFEFGGWFGATWANEKRGNGDATIYNGALALAFPDLFKEGNLGAIIVGVPPKVSEHSDSNLEDGDTSLHVEAFYRWQVSDFISITPGVFVITNPNHDSNNDAIWVGTLRTQFTF